MSNGAFDRLNERAALVGSSVRFDDGMLQSDFVLALGELALDNMKWIERNSDPQKEPGMDQAEGNGG